MGHHRMLNLTLVIALLFACSGASVTQSIQPQVELTLETAAADARDGAPTVISATSDSTILSGVIATPNPCYTLDASIQASGGELTLTVSARAKPGICVQMLGSFAYQARITGLVSGSYPTRVVYEYPGTGWESKSYDMRVTVP